MAAIWIPPPSYAIKINVSCSYSSIFRRVSVGVVVRNSRGRWIVGYYGSVEARSKTEADMWVIYMALKKISRQNPRPQVIQVETESLSAFALIFNRDVNFCMNQLSATNNVIDDGWDCTVTFVPPEANRIAKDFVFNASARNLLEIVTLDQPLPALDHHLEGDIRDYHWASRTQRYPHYMSFRSSMRYNRFRANHLENVARVQSGAQCVMELGKEADGNESSGCRDCLSSDDEGAAKSKADLEVSTKLSLGRGNFEVGESSNKRQKLNASAAICINPFNG